MDFRLFCACTTSIMLAGPIGVATADEPVTTMSVGYGETSGTYGSKTTTTIKSIPVVGTVDYGELSLMFSFPLLDVNGDPNVIPGLGSVNNTNPKKRGNGGTTSSASGIGDMVLSATYDFYTNEDEDFGLDATGSVKLPNADTSTGLGDGATDYTLELGTYQMLGPLMLMGGVSYTALGSTRYVKLNKHIVGYSLGGLLSAGDRWSLGMDLESGTPATGSTKKGDTRELTAFVIWRMTEHWKLQVHALKGFANGSPDTGWGATLRRTF